MSYGNAAYSNLAVIPSKRSALERKRAANAERDAEAALKRKVEQANRVLDALEARAAQFTAAIARYQKRKAATLARAAQIEDAILGYMDEHRLDVLTGIRCSMRAQLAAAALEVVDESLIPREYLRAPKTPPAQPDKVAIKKALAERDVDPAEWGCRLSSKVSLIRK